MGDWGRLSGRTATSILYDDDNITGRLFGPDINIENWWSSTVDEAYEQRAQCIADFYSHFTSSEQKVDGSKTVDEDIADIGGLHVAHNALSVAFRQASDAHPRLMAEAASRNRHRYQRSLRRGVMQNFFRSWAQNWCHTTSNSEGLETSLLPYAPAHSRVNAALAQFAPFAEVFECVVGSPLNPARQRCNVW